MVLFPWSSSAHINFGMTRCYLLGAGSALVFFSFLVYVWLPQQNCPIHDVHITASPRSSEDKVRVLIAGYWRSGSGFIGELFNQHSEAFYLVEPLNGYIYTPSLALKTNLDGKGNPLEKESYSPADFYENYHERSSQQLAAVLKQIFDCDFERINAGVLLHKVMKLSRSSYQFNFCLQWNGANLASCRHVLTSMCREQPIVVVKEVYARYDTIKLLLGMMTKKNSLRIVHLVRDPRAVLLSQRDRRMLREDWTLEENARQVCSMMAEDWRELQPLVDDGSVLRVFYEDAATKALDTARRLYEFVGLGEVPSHLAQWVETGTSSKQRHEREGWFSSTRKQNSTATAFAWRRRLRPDEVAQIDRGCAEFYQLVEAGRRYKVVKSEQDLALI